MCYPQNITGGVDNIAFPNFPDKETKLRELSDVPGVTRIAGSRGSTKAPYLTSSPEASTTAIPPFIALHKYCIFVNTEASISKKDYNLLKAPMMASIF